MLKFKQKKTEFNVKLVTMISTTMKEFGHTENKRKESEKIYISKCLLAIHKTRNNSIY